MAASLSPDDIAQTVAAVQGLYSAQLQLAPADQQRVQQQLVDIQRSDAAWSLIGPLLCNHDPNVRFFGAHTAGVKISRDWDSLNPEQHEPLLKSVLQWTSEVASSGPGNSVVIRKLFVALSALFFRLAPTTFPHAFITVSSILTSPSPASSLALSLEFFQIVVEEAGRTGLVGTRKLEVADALRTESETAVSYALETLQRWDGRGDEAEMLAALKCLEAWIGWGLTGDQLHTLLPTLIALLSRSETFIAASDCLQEVLTSSGSSLSSGRGSKVLTEPLLQWIFTIGRQIADACFQSGDADENATSLAKLLAALGEHSADYLALRLALPEVQAFFQIMLGFSGFEGYYGVDEDVSEITLSFWSLFQESLTASPHIDSADTPSPAVEWLMARDIFMELVRRLRRKCVWPAGDGGWMKDQKDKFRIFRNDCGDALVTAFYVLRGDMLSYLVNTLVEELSSPSGSSEQVEGTLHCLRAAQEAVPQEENDWLPRLFSSDVLGLLPATGDSRARATALDLIGDYASWFHSHPSSVLSAISYIVPALETPSLCTAAANALKHVCDMCRKSLTSHIGSFGTLYGNVQDQIEPDEKAKVLEAITSVVEALPPMDAVDPIIAITDPIVDKLGHALSLSSQLPAEARSLAILQILSLTAIAKGLTPTDDFDLDFGGDDEDKDDDGSAARARDDPRMAALRDKIVQAAGRVLELWSGDGEVSDVMSRFIRALTTSTSTPTLLSLSPAPVLILIARVSQTSLNSVWLSLAETLIGRLAPTPGLLGSGNGHASSQQSDEALVREVSASMIQRGLEMLDVRQRGFQGLLDAPDLVEGLFKFAAAVAARFPTTMMAPPLDTVNIMMELSVAGLGLQERYSLQAVTGFLTTTISRSRTPPELLEVFNPVLVAHGCAIVRAIVVGAGGGCPRSVIPHFADLMASLVARLPQECMVWLEGILQEPDFPSPRSHSASKAKFKTAVLQGRTTRKVREALNEFALVARGLEGSAYGGSTAE